MSHFAKVENGTVTQVIVAEQDFIDAGHVGDPAGWVQTSYNTRGGLHYNAETNEPDGGQALRGNYAGIGYVYNTELDAFYPPSPFPSWSLNTTTFIWEPPAPMPVVEGKIFVWDEPTTSWTEFTPPA